MAFSFLAAPRPTQQPFPAQCLPGGLCPHSRSSKLPHTNFLTLWQRKGAPWDRAWLASTSFVSRSGLHTTQTRVLIYLMHQHNENPDSAPTLKTAQPRFPQNRFYCSLPSSSHHNCFREESQHSLALHSLKTLGSVIFRNATVF